MRRGKGKIDLGQNLLSVATVAVMFKQPNPNQIVLKGPSSRLEKLIKYTN